MEKFKKIDIEDISKEEIYDNLQRCISEKIDYWNRIDKAIEYIEEHKEPLHHSFDEPDCDYWIATNPDDLLDILRGNDE